MHQLMDKIHKLKKLTLHLPLHTQRNLPLPPKKTKSHFNHLTFTLFKWKYHMHAVEKNRIPVWKRNICDLHVIFYQLTSFRFLITSRRYNSLRGWACSTCQKFENVYDIYIRPYTFWSEKLSWAKNIPGCLLQNLHYYYLIHYR